MTLPSLDRNCALVIVDLQKGIVPMVGAHIMGPVLERSVAMLEAFRRRGLTVVLVNVAGVAPGRTEEASRPITTLPEGFTDLLPDLRQQPSDIMVTKYSWGAFAATDLEARLGHWA